MANKVYNGGPAPHGHNVVYMYYVRPNEPHDQQIAVYRIEFFAGVFLNENEILKIVQNADNNVIQPVGFGINSVSWYEPCYLVFVAKSSEFTFKKNDAASFFHLSLVTPGNHNFRHGQDIPDGLGISGMWCVNKRIRGNGQPLGEKTERFWVTISGLSPFSLRPLLKLLVILKMLAHNEVGANVGP